MNLTSRLIAGLLSDHGYRHPLLTSFSLYIFATFTSACLVLCFGIFGINMGNRGFFTFMLLYGLSTGPITSMRSVLVENLFGIENINASYGWLLFSQGIFFLITFPFISWIQHHNDIYGEIFTFISLLIATFFMILNHKKFFEEGNISKLSSVKDLLP